MIGYLRGRRVWSEPGLIILDIHGTGYEIHVSGHTEEELSQKEEVHLWIYTSVREDAIHLFGFASPNEKQMFLQLLKVNGIGPKVALNILGQLRPETLMQLIETKDVKSLSSLPKVGKKTAEQMILTLKGKLGLGLAAESSPASSVRQDVSSALMNLGFSLQEVEEFVLSLPGEIDVEKAVRQGLSVLTRDH